MTSKKLARENVIASITEERDILSRLTRPRMDRLVYDSTQLTTKKIHELMAKDLNNEDWESLERAELAVTMKDQTLSVMRQIQQRLARWNNKIMGNPVYLNACESYQGQDSLSTGAFHKYNLNKFLANFAFNEIDVTADQPLFHGVTTSESADFEVPSAADSNPANWRSVKEYADILENICHEGLRASPAPENLPGLESVFAVTNPELAHGIAGVKFTLGENDKIWGMTHDPEEGLQIVKARVMRPFEIYVNAHTEYAAKLAAELQKRGLPVFSPSISHKSHVA